MRQRSLVLTLVGIALVTTLSIGQNGLGNITGHVTDAQKAYVVGARVTALNVETGVRITSTTNSVGIYEILSLNPGNYTVEVEAPSFKRLVHEHILVQAEDNLGLDLSLEVGSVSEVMTVTSQSSQLHTEDAQTGEVVTDREIQSLPLISGANGRDPLSLLSLSGDVQGSNGRAGVQLNSTQGGLTAGQSDTRINGGRSGGIEYFVDGIPATTGFSHSVVNSTPAVEDVSEFKVLTNGIPAEYGRLSGGAISVTTKSGTNEFHGQAFEYNDTAFLDANTWDNDAQCAVGNKTACSKANFRRNDFGGAFGGPVRVPHLYDGKNKTFFFANYDGYRQSSSGQLQTGQVLSLKERNSLTTPVACPDGTPGGCFDMTDIGTTFYNYNANPAPDPNAADYYAQAWNPFSPVVNGLRTQLLGGDGRHIPINMLSPLILKYVSYMPLPNRSPVVAGTGTAVNYQRAQPNRQTSDVWSVRVDHNINDRQRIFGRFTRNGAKNTYAAWWPTWGETSETRLPGGWGTELHYDYTISPTLILDLHAGGNFSPWTSGTNLPLSSAGFKYDPIDSQFLPGQILRISQGPATEGTVYDHGPVGGQFDGGGYGFESTTGSTVNSTIAEYAASLTKIIQRHSLKFGYEGRRYYDNVTTLPQSNSFGQSSNGYGFDGQAATQLAGDGNVWNQLSYNRGIAPFLLGVPSWTNESSSIGRSFASNYYAAYVQDDFKVSPRLTLNLGLRWEMESPLTERHNLGVLWNPNAPAPFTLDPSIAASPSGYWSSVLGQVAAAAPTANPAPFPLTQAEIASIPEPYWLTNGGHFANGALELASTPQHPSRLLSNYHPWNFAPRLGAAYQLERDTVLRGSFSMLYIPTSGLLSAYTDTNGVDFATSVDSEFHQQLNTGGSPVNNYTPQTLDTNPYQASDLHTYTHSSAVANSEAASTGNVGAQSIDRHLPREFDWSLGIQRQLPHNWLVEAYYSGNSSNTLLTIANVSRFPRSLYNGGPAYDANNNALPAGFNAFMYSTQVSSPTPGQIPSNPYTGQVQGGAVTQPLGILQFKYPYYGSTAVAGINSGTSNYNSGNLRVERRFANGLEVLLNYTYSKLLDDTGGADAGFGNGAGTSVGSGGKAYQSVNPSASSVYGLSTWDETHRLTVFAHYQLPFGQGRRWMNGGSGFEGNLLQAALGGWEISGQNVYRSGRPLTLALNSTGVDRNTYDIFNTFGAFAPGANESTLKLHSSNDIYPANVNRPPGVQPALNRAALNDSASAQSFTYGTLPAVFGSIRNPGYWQTDMSFMKSFPIGGGEKGSRYFQLRFDGRNIFNHPGRGAYDNNVNDSSFGFVTNSANVERHTQVSGRFVF